MTEILEGWVPKRCGARAKSTGQPCRKWSIRGKKRCRNHGGLSTGHKTAEGKAAQRRSVTKHGLYAGPGNPLVPEGGAAWHRRHNGLPRVMGEAQVAAADAALSKLLERV